jgi:hypothetical protein
MDFEYIIVPLLVVLVVYLLLREVNCWYWKINALLHAVEKTNEKLDTLISTSYANTKAVRAAAVPKPSPPEPAAPPDDPDLFACPQCKQLISVDTLKVGSGGWTGCPHCGTELEVERG